MSDYTDGVKAVLGHIEDAIGELGQNYQAYKKTNMPYAAGRAEEEFSVLRSGIAEIKAALRGGRALEPGLTKRILSMVISGLRTDGAHHKQWYLEQVLVVLGFDMIAMRKSEQDGWDEEGIVP